MITKQNKKGNALAAVLITLGILILIAIIIGSWIAGSYNTLVDKDTSVEAQFGKIQTAMERRLDLLPNLASTVKGSANFEQETLIEVAKARGGIRIANNPTSLEEANRPVMSMMAGLMTYAEQYPALKSTEAFKGLMDEIAGSENRISWERNNYNDLVKEYKAEVRKFPTTMIAGMFGFEQSKWEMYNAVQNATVAPTVDFSK
jgi:LemA protein